MQVFSFGILQRKIQYEVCFAYPDIVADLEPLVRPHVLLKHLGQSAVLPHVPLRRWNIVMNNANYGSIR